MKHNNNHQANISFQYDVCQNSFDKPQNSNILIKSLLPKAKKCLKPKLLLSFVMFNTKYDDSLIKTPRKLTKKYKQALKKTIF